MTAPDLRPCCTTAVLDGISPLDHYAVCDARREQPPAPVEEPVEDALFDITPPASNHQGGAHL